ncbi:MAG: Gfo/Idh/MocA family oxidoreductase, partial [Elusimicrobiota bacterium]
MIKIGVIGYGYWGPNLVRNFHELQGSQVAYISDLQDKNLNSAKQKYKDTILTKNYLDILNDKSVDAVVIATPVSTHFKLIKEALEHDKDVLVEKPLCTCVEEAEKLIELSEKKKKIILVSHTFLYSPPVIEMKNIISKKTLGDIYYIDSSRVNLGLFQPDVSVIWDLAPHDVSIITYWLDSVPEAVSCQAQSFIRKNIHEVAYTSIFFENKTLAHLHTSWLAPCKLRRTVVIGSEKMAIYDDIEPVEKIKIYNKGVEKNPETFGEFQLSYRSGDILSPHLA